MIVVLPWPGRKLWPNARTHYHSKAAMVADYRFVAYERCVEGLEHPLPAEGKLPLSVTFCAPTKGKRDLDNMFASIKGGLDGVADALEIDDCRFEPVTLRRGEVVKGGLVFVQIGGVQ